MIKFKAITTEGKWVEGDLIHLDDRTMIAGAEMPAYDTGNVYDNVTLECVQIIPETVCQFTGLYDKNGKEIYSGDETDNMHVFYCAKQAAFCIDFSLLQNENSFYSEPLSDHISDLEITGSIHDKHLKDG